MNDSVHEMSVFDDLEYKKMDQREHVLAKPSMYIGTISEILRDELAFDVETGKLSTIETMTPKAMTHLFMEVLMNAADNIFESETVGLDPGVIEVEMTPKRVLIRNGGRPIPVEIHKDSGVYNPQFIFGNLLSSSHYEESRKRYSCGTNGLGAKCVNIWSTEFIVRVIDSFNKKFFEGTWRNNMTTDPVVVVDDYDGTENFVEVEWEVDFERFGMTQYPDDTFAIFAGALMGVSMCCKIPVSFNGHQFNFSEPRDFCRAYFGDLANSALVHREWSDGTPEFNKPYKKRRGKFISLEIVYLDTPSEGTQLSFANAMNTIRGGPYVNTSFSAFSKRVLETIKKKEQRLTVREVKKHTSMMINAFVENPSYGGQMKETLEAPDIKVKLPDELVERVSRWKLIECLKLEAQSKQLLKLKTTDGKRKRIVTGKFQDANFVTSRPAECVLHITEGLSASQLSFARMQFEGGPDYHAVLPLSGKVPNALNAEIEDILKNEQYKNIKQALGLQEGVDYSIPSNKARLKYGLVKIETDADDDGKHICGLLLCFFMRFYPSLIKIGMITYLDYSLVKMFDGNRIVERFHTLREYQDYMAVNPKCSYRVQYYKGLGSTEMEEISEDVKYDPTVVVVFDDDAEASIDLAFNRENADDRKVWITKYRELLGDCEIEKISITNWRQNLTSFINHQLIDYTLTNLVRSLPCFDGFKMVQRKILYGLLKKCKWKPAAERIKVAAFAGHIIEKMAYHHGPKALEDAIIKMAQGFVGSNNLPLLQARSMIGSRKMGGKDAPAGRYAYINLAKYTAALCPRELVDLVPRRLDEGKEIEPETIPSIVSLALVNGFRGIATGWSTASPPFNIHDLIRWLRQRCSGIENPDPIEPYFQGFRGEVQITRAAPGNEIVEDEDPEDPEIAIPEPTVVDKRVVTKGIFSVKYVGKDSKKIITISELPVGVWTNTYIEKLQEMNTDKKLYYDDIFLRNGKNDEPCIVLEGWNSTKVVNEDSLLLSKSFSMTNIMMVDSQGYPHHLTVPLMLESHYRYMIDIFERYLAKVLEDLEYSKLLAENELMFLDAVLEKKISLYKKTTPSERLAAEEKQRAKILEENSTLDEPLEGEALQEKIETDIANTKYLRRTKSKSKSVLLEEMVEYGIQEAEVILSKSKIANLTTEMKDKIAKKIVSLQEDIDAYTVMTPQEVWLTYLDNLEKKL
jgi:DNA topoisomerase-2